MQYMHAPWVVFTRQETSFLFTWLLITTGLSVMLWQYKRAQNDKKPNSRLITGGLIVATVAFVLGIGVYVMQIPEIRQFSLDINRAIARLFRSSSNGGISVTGVMVGGVALAILIFLWWKRRKLGIVVAILLVGSVFYTSPTFQSISDGYIKLTGETLPNGYKNVFPGSAGDPGGPSS